MGVHAQVGSDDRFHVHRPAEPGGVDQALDARRSRAADIKPDAADLAPRSPAIGASSGSGARGGRRAGLRRFAAIGFFADFLAVFCATFFFLAITPSPSLFRARAS